MRTYIFSKDPTHSSYKWDPWSVMGSGKSPSCEVTKHVVTWVLNVNHHWWIDSGSRESVWQISHLNCTCAKCSHKGQCTCWNTHAHTITHTDRVTFYAHLDACAWSKHCRVIRCVACHYKRTNWITTDKDNALKQAVSTHNLSSRPSYKGRKPQIIKQEKKENKHGVNLNILISYLNEQIHFFYSFFCFLFTSLLLIQEVIWSQLITWNLFQNFYACQNTIFNLSVSESKDLFCMPFVDYYNWCWNTSI